MRVVLLSFGGTILMAMVLGSAPGLREAAFTTKLVEKELMIARWLKV